jgi:hypothetical protein
MISVHIRDYASGETLFNHQLKISYVEDPLPVKTYISIHIQSLPDTPSIYVDAISWRRVGDCFELYQQRHSSFLFG